MKDIIGETLNMFIEEDLLDDKREYDISDLKSAYHIVTESEVAKLIEIIQEVINGLHT
ncbi:MAG: hypothetical protein N3D15_02805 [Syntrophorhabdaceae bacterium]|nr:hypothetical protein [Syntrophorhabdaceae bacterium]